MCKLLIWFKTVAIHRLTDVDFTRDVSNNVSIQVVCFQNRINNRQWSKSMKWEAIKEPPTHEHGCKESIWIRFRSRAGNSCSGVYYGRQLLIIIASHNTNILISEKRRINELVDVLCIWNRYMSWRYIDVVLKTYKSDKTDFDLTTNIGWRSHCSRSAVPYIQARQLSHHQLSLIIICILISVTHYLMNVQLILMYLTRSVWVLEYLFT